MGWTDGTLLQIGQPTTDLWTVNYQQAAGGVGGGGLSCRERGLAG